MLYGRSGGAYLIHQYLSRHGARVARAFTQSPVNPPLNRELGIAIDRFWEELGAQDRGLQELLRKALARDPGERLRVLVTLQRQHFFVPAERIAAARAELIRALAEGDAALYERARKEYQADDVLKLYESAESIPQVVRVLELIHPSGAFLSSRPTARASTSSPTGPRPARRRATSTSGWSSVRARAGASRRTSARRSTPNATSGSPP